MAGMRGYATLKKERGGVVSVVRGAAFRLVNWHTQKRRVEEREKVFAPLLMRQDNHVLMHSLQCQSRGRKDGKLNHTMFWDQPQSSVFW
jgi:hypothetical protein